MLPKYLGWRRPESIGRRISFHTGRQQSLEHAVMRLRQMAKRFEYTELRDFAHSGANQLQDHANHAGRQASWLKFWWGA